MIDHRIHVACCDAEKEIWATQRCKGFNRSPIRLRDHAHPESLRFQYTTNHSHAKAGMIDVTVSRNDDDVAAIPAKLVHFLSGHW